MNQGAKAPGVLALLGPGLLVAATGVGAGDLATATLTGSRLGTAILWAVVVGGFLKFVLTEGLTRWQLATGQTLLEGAARHFGPVAGWLFLPYLILWSFFVSSALMSACGVTLHALFPIFSDAETGKVVFGILSSLVGLGLVLLGGFELFSKIMRVCIGLMFGVILLATFFLWPGTEAFLDGLFRPSIPDADGAGIGWTIALMGGVGGTVTILSYGYWIQEVGRVGRHQLRACRLDLGVGYLVTIVFGLAMVMIGSTVEVVGGGATLLVTLGDQLAAEVGQAGRLIFLIGAFGAVFSSLLGVWQAVPYLFADLWRLFLQRDRQELRDSAADGSSMLPVDTSSRPYRAYLYAIAIIPMLGFTAFNFVQAQWLYAVSGAAFIPMLALALLVFNGRRAWVGDAVNRIPTTVILAATLALFGWLAWGTIAG